MTVRRALSRAKMLHNTQVHLVKSARLPNDILVVQYRTDSYVADKKEPNILRTYRLDIYNKDYLVGGFIVFTEWLPQPPQRF